MSLTYATIPVEGAPSLPVLTLDAPGPGPCLVVTANLHGDEVTGLVACQRLAQALDGEILRGRLVLLPSLNPQGLAALSRTVPADGGDLNRSFPGRRRGRGVDRLAATIWQAVCGFEPTAVLDLHADSGRSIPYVLVDRPLRLRGPDRLRMRERLASLAASAGLTVVHEYDASLYLRYSLDRSLSGALINRAGVPALTIEAGPRRAIDASAVDSAVHAVRGVLGELDMAPPPPAAHPSFVPGRWRRIAAPRAPAAGWWDPVVEAGQIVARGDHLGVVRQVDGRPLQALPAEDDALVVSWVEPAWVGAGAAVGTLAIEEASR